MTKFSPRAVAAFALVASACAAITFGGAQAQEVEFDTDQVANLTKAVSFDLNAEFTVPTRKMEAQYAELENELTIKPDMSFARNDQETDEEPVMVASAW